MLLTHQLFGFELNLDFFNLELVSGIFSLFELLLDKVFLLLFAFNDLLMLIIEFASQILFDQPFLFFLLRLHFSLFLQSLPLNMKEALSLFFLSQKLLLVFFGLESFFTLSCFDEHILLPLFNLLQVFTYLLFFKIFDPLFFCHSSMLALSNAIPFWSMDFFHGLF